MSRTLSVVLPNIPVPEYLIMAVTCICEPGTIADLKNIPSGRAEIVLPLPPMILTLVTCTSSCIMARLFTDITVPYVPPSIRTCQACVPFRAGIGVTAYVGILLFAPPVKPLAVVPSMYSSESLIVAAVTASVAVAPGIL